MAPAFTSAGNNVTQRVVFNSGTIDFGTQRLVDVNDINISLEYSLESLYVLGSIKPQDICRHSQKVTISGKIKTFSPEILSMTAGASTAGTPTGIETLDGQPTMTAPVLTFFDRNAKQIQYQLTGAIFKTNKLTATNEAYAEIDFELEAKDITEIVYTA